MSGLGFLIFYLVNQKYKEQRAEVPVLRFFCRWNGIITCSVLLFNQHKRQCCYYTERPSVKNQFFACFVAIFSNFYSMPPLFGIVKFFNFNLCQAKNFFCLHTKVPHFLLGNFSPIKFGFKHWAFFLMDGFILMYCCLFLQIPYRWFWNILMPPLTENIEFFFTYKYT